MVLCNIKCCGDGVVVLIQNVLHCHNVIIVVSEMWCGLCGGVGGGELYHESGENGKILRSNVLKIDYLDDAHYCPHWW